MSDARDHEVPEDTTRDDEVSERRKEFTRRVLIRAGWVVPLVTTVNIPSASAQSPTPHNDVHGDSPHQDQLSEHLDVHLDSLLTTHSDHSDHADTPHSDTPHTEIRMRTHRTPTSRTVTRRRTPTSHMRTSRRTATM